MYECIMGMKKMEGTGCILADEMGLGKTLQTISLIYTLLRESISAAMSVDQASLTDIVIRRTFRAKSLWRPFGRRSVSCDLVGILLDSRNDRSMAPSVSEKYWSSVQYPSCRIGRRNSTNGSFLQRNRRSHNLDRPALVRCRLGRHRIGVFVGDGDKNKIRQFVGSHLPWSDYDDLF